MAEAVDVALLPFRLAFRLVKLLFVPVACCAGALGLVWLGLTWCLPVAIVAGIWAVVMVWLWWLQVVGELRSIGRGTVRISGGRGSGGWR